MDTVPSFSEYAVMKLVSIARKRKQTHTANSSANATTIVRLVLHIAGFALLTIAAFQFNMIAGYAVAGLSCFLLSTLLTGQTEEIKRDPALRTGR